jgi:anti-sigma B factor antagonist
MAVPATRGDERVDPDAFTLGVTDSDEDRTVVSVRGEVDVSTATQLRDGLYRLVAGGQSNLVIDLSAMTFIDSTGLGVLVGAVKRAREAGGDVALANPSRPILKVLEISGLSRIVAIVNLD